MPKTTKETIKKKSENLSSKTSTATKTTTKKTTTSKTKNTVAESKKSNSTKKVSSKKTPSKKVVNSKTKSNKKSTTSKVAKAKTTKATTKSKKIQILEAFEYYDLPYRYNQTIVKILAQTPKTLFVYWDISDKDRENYIKQYGENFFNDTKPVLIVHNETMNYSFEIEINDFANCWYFNINDEKCKYSVELGRRPKEKHNNYISITNNYLYIASSNNIESPNGHILFEKEQNTIFYKNVKTNETYSKDIVNLIFMQNLGKVYKSQDIYKKIYKEDEILSFNNPSSTFK